MRNVVGTMEQKILVYDHWGCMATTAQTEVGDPQHVQILMYHKALAEE